MKHLLKSRLRRIFIISYDILTVPLAWFGAYWLRFNLAVIPTHILNASIKALPVVLLIQVLAFWFFGLYRGVWRFSSLHDLLRILKAVAIASLSIIFILLLHSRLQGIPRSIIPLYALLLTALLGGARFTIRLVKESMTLFSDGQRVLILGAGAAGESLVRDLKRDAATKFKPVAFLDDKKSKRGQEIRGVRVLGCISDIAKIVEKYPVDLIFIAIPSATSAEMRRIISHCEKISIPFRTLPSLKNIAHGHVSVDALRQVSVEDLLGRETVNLEWSHIREEIENKVVLVTGGGGSIGSELCRQIAKVPPKHLVIIDNSEYSLYKIRVELEEKFPALQFTRYLIDVTDRTAVKEIIQRYRFDIIFHAAAYKHVPMLEFQVRTAIRNNIIGTCNVAEEALAFNVKKFVLVSTDKAVHPTNVMGATKRAAEILCQYYNAMEKTQFITVRFGNVLGSNGSVVPLFTQQIKQGGPVTVTHPDITRYFMTIPEATQLILQATSMSKGGELFVLDMGEPVNINDLAKQMIMLADLKPDKDIEIKYTGLRPGEKLFEELFYDGEQLIKTGHDKIFQAQNKTIACQSPITITQQMKVFCEENDEVNLRQLLHEFVPEYAQQQSCVIKS